MPFAYMSARRFMRSTLPFLAKVSAIEIVWWNKSSSKIWPEAIREIKLTIDSDIPDLADSRNKDAALEMSFSTPLPSLYSSASFILDHAFPERAARLYQYAVFTKSLSTHMPFAYMSARAFIASMSPLICADFFNNTIVCSTRLLSQTMPPKNILMIFNIDSVNPISEDSINKSAARV